MKKKFFLCLASIPLLSCPAVDAEQSKSTRAFTRLPGLVQEPLLEKDLAILENRFFFHGYAQDPLPKRLERLELLVLGATQGGADKDRLARLKAAILEKDKNSAQSMARQKKETPQSDYPVLSTLEWRILKKTYAGGALDERLARLEKQLFGVPAEAMSYADRIERLKKTVGMGELAAVPSKRVLRPNLMPRDGANGGNGQGYHQKFSGKTPDGNGFYSFEFHSNVAPDGSFDGGMTVPGFPFDSASPGDTGSFARLWQRMNQDMEEMMQDFPATPGMTPLIPRSRQLKVPPVPRTPGGSLEGSAPAPGSKKPRSLLTPREELPPYLDPNSI